MNIKRLYDNSITKILLIALIPINGIWLIHYCSGYFFPPIIDQQNVYYLYSSAVQAIATFVAFLIAGYALVYQAMDNLENRDETLAEIHYKIKMDYYLKIKILTVITGLTIVLCLVVIWLNGYSIDITKILIVLANIFIIITIVVGLWFVTYMIDPNKIRKAALELISENFKDTGDTADEGEFIKAFISIEILLREIIKRNDIPVDQTRYLSYKGMIDTLRRNEFIDLNLYNKMLELGKYRNLVVHGHVTTVDRQLFIETQEILEELRRIDHDRSRSNISPSS